MRNRIYKYFLLSFLIVAGGIVYFVMLHSNRIVIKSAATESLGEAGNGAVLAERSPEIGEKKEPKKEPKKEREKEQNKESAKEWDNQDKELAIAQGKEQGIEQAKERNGESDKQADKQGDMVSPLNLSGVSREGQGSVPDFLPESEQRERQKPESAPVQELGTGEKKVNINTASKAELMTLKGIGEKKAELIIRNRKEQGVFRRIEDIMRIKGIKRKAFQRIKDQIVVSD